MRQTLFALVAAITATVLSSQVSLAGEHDDAVWLARFTQTSERMLSLAIERRDVLALETNAVLFDIAIEQAGLSAESQFSSCWRAAIALQGLIGHLLTFTGDARPVLGERVHAAYQLAMSDCEQLLGEHIERVLSRQSVESFAAPQPSELTQVAQ